ncbi:MAG: hypothetical protein WCV67_08890 [Victivallaceae bacterium]|jgi:hypothetical protein
MAQNRGFYCSDTDSPATLASRGVNFAMAYRSFNKPLLDSFDAAGLKVIVYIPSTMVAAVDPNTPATLNPIRNYITGLQTNGCDHPAAIGWYLADEPELTGISPAQTAAAYALIKSLSPLKVYMCFAGLYGYIEPRSKSNALAYAASYDVLMFDTYLCHNSNVPGRNAEFKVFSYYWNWMKLNAIYAGMAADLGKEYCPAMQAFGAQPTNDSRYELYKNWRLPTFNEARAQAHLGIQTNVKRLIWYAHSRALTSVALPAEIYPYDGVTWLGPGANSVFDAIINELTAYGDAIENGEIVGGLKSVSDANIMDKVFYSPSNNKTYIFALNTANATVSNVEFALNLDKTYSLATRVGARESGAVAISSGAFFDSFTCYQAHIYELDTTGQPVIPSTTPIQACTLKIDLTSNDGLFDFSVQNDAASASGISRVVLSGAGDITTFGTFNTPSPQTFSVVPPLNYNPSNCINNPGFETTPQYWSSGTGYAIQAGVGRNGGNGLRCYRASVIPDGQPCQFTVQRIPIQARPGTVYHVGCWIKTTDVQEVGYDGGGRLGVEWYGAASAFITAKYSRGLTGNNDWTFVQITSECPNGVNEGYIVLNVARNTTGTIDFDDVSVLAFENDAGIVNPGFENDASGWSKNSKFSVVTDYKHSGSKSLYYSRSDANEYVFTSQTLSAVTPGVSYSLGGWFKNVGISPSAMDGARIGLEWYDANNNYISSGIYSSGVSGTREWKFASAKGICPSGGDHAYVRLFLKHYSTGQVYFDDISCYSYPSGRDAVLVFSPGLEAGGIASTTANRVFPEYAGGMTGTVYFANGYRLQGIFRDKGDSDDDNEIHYVAELSNTKKARVEINGIDGYCCVWNNSKSVRIKRVRIDSSNKVFDLFAGGTGFSVISNAGAANDSILADYALLNFPDDGLAPAESASNANGSCDLEMTPGTLTATVYFSDGTSVSGPMANVNNVYVFEN